MTLCRPVTPMHGCQLESMPKTWDSGKVLTHIHHCIRYLTSYLCHISAGKADAPPLHQATYTLQVYHVQDEV